MPIIFISYRRSDSQDVTGRIYDRLLTKFTRRQVFKDVDNIPLGVSFALHIGQVLSKASVVLVIIGPGWLTASDGQGRRRLDDPNDLVRVEVESALRAGMPVVPVLVSNASMPLASDLPRSMQKLVSRHGILIRPDPDFNHDIGRLLSALEHLDELLQSQPAYQAKAATESTPTRAEKSCAIPPILMPQEAGRFPPPLPAQQSAIYEAVLVAEEAHPNRSPSSVEAKETASKTRKVKGDTDKVCLRCPWCKTWVLDQEEGEAIRCSKCARSFKKNAAGGAEAVSDVHVLSDLGPVFGGLGLAALFGVATYFCWANPNALVGGVLKFAYLGLPPLLAIFFLLMSFGGFHSGHEFRCSCCDKTNSIRLWKDESRCERCARVHVVTWD